MLMLPELIVVGCAVVLLLLGAFASEVRRLHAPVALAGLVLALLALAFTVPRDGEILGGRFGMDPVTWWFKVIFLVSGAFSVLLSQDMLNGRVAEPGRHAASGAEFYMVLFSTLVGMMFLVSSRDLVTMYVSLETSTIPLFLLAAWKRDDALSGEAGLKFVVIGAMASAVLLYGLGLAYGLTGTMDLDAMRQSLRSTPALWAAFALVLAGVGFKMTIVPFHMWAADVYQGAPIPVTAYLSVASKAAGLAFLFHLVYRIMGLHLEQWTPLLAILSVITMTLGNVVAIVQENIKRFMAFSSVSQAGYLLMGFLGNGRDGVPAILFYMLVYVFSNLCVFAVITFYANETGRERIGDYRGLSRLHPLIALSMMLGLFSLAGIPPLAGFTGKFFLFSIASEAGYHWLVAAAAINSTISLYYYLRIVRQMYIEPVPDGEHRLALSPAVGSTLMLTVAGTVLLGIVPAAYDWIFRDSSGWMRLLGLER